MQITKTFVITKVKNEQYDLSSHAHQERQEEKISIEEIEKALVEGDIIEEYPNDPRGESCLIATQAEESLHVICGTRSKRLLVVTIYRPKKPVWINYKTRAKELKSRV